MKKASAPKPQGHAPIIKKNYDVKEEERKKNVFHCTEANIHNNVINIMGGHKYTL